ncbi:hypothetical protein LCGC14_3058430, partial [marine sediment metagenome]
IDYVWTRTSGSINADIVKTITDTFLNQYDGFSNYQKLYDITVDFDYTFTKDNSLYTDLAKIYITYGASQDSFNLIKEGTPQSFSYTFEFDSATESGFEVKFEISNGQLDLSNMDYSYLFKCIENPSGNIVLQQEFEVSYPYNFYRTTEHLLVDIDYSFVNNPNGITYYNTYGRTNKFEIIFQVKARGEWYEQVYAKSTSTAEIYTFDLSQFIITNQLRYLEDFKIKFVLIGEDTEIIVSSISLRNQMEIKEFYRIIDLESGFVSEWIEFNSGTILKLSDLAYLPNKFTIEYKVIDPAGNEATVSTYNGGFEYLGFSTEKTLTWTDDNIDLNSVSQIDRTLSITADFGGIPNLD